MAKDTFGVTYEVLYYDIGHVGPVGILLFVEAVNGADNQLKDRNGSVLATDSDKVRVGPVLGTKDPGILFAHCEELDAFAREHSALFVRTADNEELALIVPVDLSGVESEFTVLGGLERANKK